MKITRDKFMKKLYMKSENISSRKRSTPSSDAVDMRLSGIEFGLDKYGNSFVRTYWFKDGLPQHKGYSVKVPKDSLVDTMRFVLDNDVVEDVNEAVDIFADTPVDDVETTTEADVNNTTDIVAEDDVKDVYDLELPEGLKATKEKLTKDEIRRQREQRAILDSVDETPEGWEDL